VAATPTGPDAPTELDDGDGAGSLAIGMGRIGETQAITSESEVQVTGEILERLDAGARVLVPGPDGRLVAATVRQQQAGYYELEIGGSGEVVWVPRANVVVDH